DIQEFKEISGKGLSYRHNNRLVLIGNAQLVESTEEDDTTKIYIKIEQEIIGTISFGDQIKEGTKEAIKKLHELGIKTRMFTGDNKNIAQKIGNELEIKNVKAEMLPQDKYNELEKLLNKNKNVAFVGDGINDSPVLARADVGISMGGVGSESAIEASDVVIMTDNICKIIDAIKISKKTCTIIKQNLIFSIGVKVLILLLSTLGIGGMWQAVFADVGVTIITVNPPWMVLLNCTSTPAEQILLRLSAANFSISAFFSAGRITSRATESVFAGLNAATIVFTISFRNSVSDVAPFTGASAFVTMAFSICCFTAVNVWAAAIFTSFSVFDLSSAASACALARIS
ncbi:MAG: HAD-IC family P-type ATPase, partial [Bacteroidales bacterium]|nr:HAD-IC family P-type ATPase [Bacteroidales bacterium]